MTHDPLCPEGAERDEWPWPCMCDLIAKVRADEREDDMAQRKALARMLLDSGDITPMGARLLTMDRHVEQ